MDLLKKRKEKKSEVAIIMLRTIDDVNTDDGDIDIGSNIIDTSNKCTYTHDKYYYKNTILVL